MPGFSLSLLDILFSTFGGVILLSVLFSALISDRAVIESGNFTHISAKFTYTNPTPPSVPSASSDLRIQLKDESGRTIELKNEATLLTADDAAIYAGYSSSISMIVYRKFDAGVPSDHVELIYIADPKGTENLRVKVYPDNDFDLCVEGGSLKISVETQIRARRWVEQQTIPCERANSEHAFDNYLRFPLSKDFTQLNSKE